MTYFRIHPAHRDPHAIVGTHNVSRMWYGGTDGDEPRPGISVCRSLDDLRAYFWVRGRGGGADLDLDQIEGDVIVVLEGEPSDAEDHDAHHPGAPLLVHPTRVVRVIPDAIRVLRLDDAGYWPAIHGPLPEVP